MSTHYGYRSQYPHPDRPIPYRGEASTHGSGTSSRASNERTQTQPVDPASGGWDVDASGFSPTAPSQAQPRGRRPVPASRQHRHTRDWVSQQSYPNIPSQLELEVGVETNAARPLVVAPRPPSPLVEAIVPILPQEEQVVTGPDGWPSPSQDTELEVPDSTSTDLSTTSELGSSSIEVVIDPLTADPPFVDEEEVDDSATDRPSTPPPPPTFNPTTHGRSYAARHLQYFGPNVLSVPNPRKWGPSDGDEDIPDVVEGTSSPDSDDEVARPTSAPLTPPAVVSYVSSEDEETVPVTPLAHLAINETPEADTPAPQVVPKVPRPTIRSVEADGETLGEADRPKRQGYRHRGPGSAGAWWKKDPHPAYSYEFADRRLLVSFPFPIRLESIRGMLYDHFSKYGEIRCTVHHQANQQSAEKAIVVFWHLESIENCLSDPDRHHCELRSFRNSSRFDIEIEQLPSHALTRMIFIKLTGPRSDTRSRSASPLTPPGASQRGEGTMENGDFRVIPRQVTLWAMPWRSKRNAHPNPRLEWWAKVFIGDGPDSHTINRCREETGQAPVYLDTVQMDRRVEERNIVPRLCDFFSHLIDIVAPTSREQGWLICVSGQRDAERIMNEVGCIPGFTTRWANEGDGADNQTTPNRSPRSPLARLEKYTGAPIARAQQTPKRSGPLSLALPKSSPSRRSHGSAKSQSHRSIQTRSVPPMTPPQSPEISAEDLPSEYPHLRKRVAPTYKGRLLKVEIHDGEKRYIDESAIFVGRLVKGVETEHSLLERFGQYGPVCEIEYKPKNSTSTYGTGRILYADPESAARALHYQNGAVSNGSGLKLEMRKVLPQDVKMKTIYIDHLGRPVSPSMVHQYSPPQVPAPISYPAPSPAAPGPLPILSGPVTPVTDHHHISMPPPQPPFQGPGGMPFPPNFWPVYMGGPGPHGSPHLSQHGMQPGPMFIGYPGPPPPPMMGTPPIPHQNLGPGMMSHPLMHQNMRNLGFVPVYPHIPPPHEQMNVYPLSPVFHPEEAVLEQHQFTPEPHPTIVIPQRADSPPGTPSPIQSPRSSSAPKIVGYKSENGVFKVVYDPEDLKRYQQEHVTESEPEAQRETQNVVERHQVTHSGYEGRPQSHSEYQSQVPDQPYFTQPQRPITPDGSGLVSPPFERPRTSPGRVREILPSRSQMRRASLAPSPHPSTIFDGGQGYPRGHVPNVRGTPVPIPFIEATPLTSQISGSRAPSQASQPVQQYRSDPYGPPPHVGYGNYPRYNVPFDDPAIVQGPPGGPTGVSSLPVHGRAGSQGGFTAVRGKTRQDGGDDRGGPSGVRGGRGGYNSRTVPYGYRAEETGW